MTGEPVLATSAIACSLICQRTLWVFNSLNHWRKPCWPSSTHWLRGCLPSRASLLRDLIFLPSSFHSLPRFLFLPHSFAHPYTSSSYRRSSSSSSLASLYSSALQPLGHVEDINTKTDMRTWRFLSSPRPRVSVTTFHVSESIVLFLFFFSYCSSVKVSYSWMICLPGTLFSLLCGFVSSL